MKRETDWPWGSWMPWPHDPPGLWLNARRWEEDPVIRGSTLVERGVHHVLMLLYGYRQGNLPRDRAALLREIRRFCRPATGRELLAYFQDCPLAAVWEPYPGRPDLLWFPDAREFVRWDPPETWQ